MRDTLDRSGLHEVAPRRGRQATLLACRGDELDVWRMETSAYPARHLSDACKKLGCVK